MLAAMELRACRLIGYATAALVVLLANTAFAKRAPPTDVPPIVDGNVRYEAPHFGNPCGQNGGCVVAYDDASNAMLWSVQVYCTHYDPGLEADVQDVFITSLAAQGGQILVANEKGQHFTIDPATRRVDGDARGCGDSEGCGLLATRSTPLAGWIVGVLGLLGLAGMIRWRKRFG
jgi:hypothetical protein